MHSKQNKKYILIYEVPTRKDQFLIFTYVGLLINYRTKQVYKKLSGITTQLSFV